MKRTILPVFPVLLAALTIMAGHADEKIKPDAPNAEAIAFFESKVRPLLVERCFSCHGEINQKNGLRLDSRAAMLKGGGRGPAIVVGNPAKSLLLQTVKHEGDLKMPPGGGQLRPDEIAILTAWVKSGAVWPESEKPRPGGLFSPEKRNFWSFRPVKKTAPPKVKNTAWVKNPIDAFILARLEAKRLKPAPPADRRTLLRRVTYDLIGLPPTPEEIDTFLADKSPNAYEKVIDRLLASPHYGERWGRHWLDVARYADSNGLDENIAFGNAWRYRDYVVAAFNADKPYNQFIMEQIAGDLMDSADPKIRHERLTATGFLGLGAKVLAEPDKPKMVMDIVDEQIELVTKTVMGLTVSCARCHDHKFDPISTQDYYALAGIFKSTRTMETLNTVARVYERPLLTPELEAERTRYQEQLEAKQMAVKTVKDRANSELHAALKRDAVKYLLAGWEAAQQPELRSLAETPARPGETRMVIEAEKFDRGNLARDFVTYGKDIGIIHNINTPDVAEWDFTLPAGGNYQIELRYASNQKRPVKLSLNGKVLLPETAGQDTGSFQPDGQRWEVQGVFAFLAGKNTVRIDCDGPIPHFDKLLIVSPLQTPKPRNAPVRSLEQIAQHYGLIAPVVKRWGDHLAQARNSPVFYAFAALAEKLDAAPGQPASITFRSDLVLNEAVRAALNGVAVGSLADLAERYGKLFTAEGNAPGIDPIRNLLTSDKGLFALPEKPETYYPETMRVALTQAEEAVNAAKASEPKVPMVIAVEEQKKIENCRVHIRGNTLSLGEEVPRRFLTVLGDTRLKPVSETQSGRLELAQWLVRPDHTLTARVAVNRLWQQHFGQGFVRTPDNYGFLGEKPTHPELLDWLASTFVAQGWSQKKFHRLVLLSNTYRMSSAHDAKAMLADPDNRLLWRMNRRRLEAEPFRDAIFAVAGTLDRTMGGTLLTTGNHEYVTNDQSGNGARYAAPRRSLYLPVIRNAVYDVFQAFDFGDPSLVNAQRATTTVAPQALFAMNSSLVMEQSKAWAASLLKRANANDAARVRHAYVQAFARPPQPTEVQNALGYLSRYGERIAPTEPDAAKRREKAWASLCHILFASNEFLYLN